MTLRFLLRLVPEREDFLPDIIAELPSIELVRDRARNAMVTWLDALNASANDPTVHLEDDIIPTRGLEAKLRTVIDQHPHEVVQFFSLRPSDIHLGPRHMPGRSFSMSQCTYFPAGYPALLNAYYPEWPRRIIGPTAYDWMVADWLQSRGERYWLHVPSLVQHRQVRSLIDRRRSSHRQSPTFKEG